MNICKKSFQKSFANFEVCIHSILTQIKLQQPGQNGLFELLQYHLCLQRTESCINFFSNSNYNMM